MAEASDWQKTFLEEIKRLESLKQKLWGRFVANEKRVYSGLKLCLHKNQVAEAEAAAKAVVAGAVAEAVAEAVAVAIAEAAAKAAKPADCAGPAQPNQGDKSDTMPLPRELILCEICNEQPPPGFFEMREELVKAYGSLAGVHLTCMHSGESGGRDNDFAMMGMFSCTQMVLNLSNELFHLGVADAHHKKYSTFRGCIQDGIENASAQIAKHR